MRALNTKIQVKTSGWKGLTSILPGAFAPLFIAILSLWSCSNGYFSVNSKTVPIGIDLSYRPPQSLNLEGRLDAGLNLVSTGTALKVQVSSCASGYTTGSVASPTAITSGVVNLYKGDQGCLVKLVDFTLGSITYTADSSRGTGAVNFSAWSAGSVASFAKVGGTGAAGDLIKVFVITQVSSILTTSDTISYAFTDISAGSTNTVSQANVSTAVPLSATGRVAPNLSIAQARYLSTNANGSANMSFTITCGSAVTGTTPDFNCPNAADTSGLSGATTDNLATQIKYLFIPDTYSACAASPTALTVAQANGFFASPPNGTTVQTITAALSSTSGGGSAGEIAAGGSDNYANVITNGGFSTPSVVTGNLAIYPSNLKGIFLIQRLDTAGTPNIVSYLYQCVDIASITQS